MTADEAIKILTDTPIATASDDTEKYHRAARLGIEALKRVRDSRRPDPLYPDELLPGETEE